MKMPDDYGGELRYIDAAGELVTLRVSRAVVSKWIKSGKPMTIDCGPGGRLELWAKVGLARGKRGNNKGV